MPTPAIAYMGCIIDVAHICNAFRSEIYAPAQNIEDWAKRILIKRMK